MKQVVSQTKRRNDVASNDNPSSKDVPVSKGKEKRGGRTREEVGKPQQLTGSERKWGEGKKERKKKRTSERRNQQGWKLEVDG